MSGSGKSKRKLETNKELVDEWESKVDNIVRSYRELSAACDSARVCGTLCIEGRLSDAIWKAFFVTLGEFDVEGWIDWHIRENDCGKSGMEVISQSGPSRKIRTSRQLAEMIAASIVAAGTKKEGGEQ